MRANRDDDTPFVHEQPRGNNKTMIVAGSIAVLALLLYVVLDDPDEAAPVPASQQVIRDSAVVAPPVVDTPAPATQTPAAPGNTPDGFSERQLAPPSSTVGAGTAPVVEDADADGERIVIDGELLKELEEDAQAQGPAAED